MELKLIIADDNALTIEGILHHVDFRSLNIEVVQVCADGASALDYAMHHDVDIINSDIKMPRLTGLEMAQKMLAHKPLMRFIFISAYSDYQFARDSIRLGALDYVEKPVDYTQLISVLSQATAKIRQERETQQLLENSRDALMQQFLQTLAHSTADVAESQLEQLTPYLNIPRDTTGFSCCIISFPNISYSRNMALCMRSINVFSCDPCWRKPSAAAVCSPAMTAIPCWYFFVCRRPPLRVQLLQCTPSGSSFNRPMRTAG